MPNQQHETEKKTKSNEKAQLLLTIRAICMILLKKPYCATHSCKFRQPNQCLPIRPVSYVTLYGTGFRCLLHIISTSGDTYYNAISLDVLVFCMIEQFSVHSLRRRSTIGVQRSLSRGQAGRAGHHVLICTQSFHSTNTLEWVKSLDMWSRLSITAGVTCVGSNYSLFYLFELGNQVQCQGHIGTYRHHSTYKSDMWQHKKIGKKYTIKYKNNTKGSNATNTNFNFKSSQTETNLYA